MCTIETVTVNSISNYIEQILNFDLTENETIYFRGEPKDFKETAFQPSIYRSKEISLNEHKLFREMQRFNDAEFHIDVSTIDKLSRMQHYLTPTRLIDLSEDAMTALFFSFISKDEKSKDDNPVVYVISVNTDKIKYYDSDAVSVIANLAKIPIENSQNTLKSKNQILSSAIKSFKAIDPTKEFNTESCIDYLLHEIKEDKGYFEKKINPAHITSTLCVKPKLSNTRINGQKGAFLLFGLNIQDSASHPSFLHKVSDDVIKLVNIENQDHPITKIKKIIIDKNKVDLLQLQKIGLSQPYIYTGLDKISEYFKNYYAKKI